MGVLVSVAHAVGSPERKRGAVRTHGKARKLLNLMFAECLSDKDLVYSIG